MTAAPINQLPTDMLTLIFSQSVDQLENVPNVCKLWSDILKNRSFWNSLKAIYPQEFWKERMHSAITSSQVNKVGILLNVIPVDAIIEEESRETLLHVAAFEGRARIIGLLIRRGAPLNPRNHVGMTPLYRTIDKKFNQCAKLLLANGADPTIPENSLSESDVRSPLKLAQGNEELYTLLRKAIGDKCSL